MEKLAKFLGWRSNSCTKQYLVSKYSSLPVGGVMIKSWLLTSLGLKSLWEDFGCVSRKVWGGNSHPGGTAILWDLGLSKKDKVSQEPAFIPDLMLMQGVQLLNSKVLFGVCVYSFVVVIRKLRQVWIKS